LVSVKDFNSPEKANYSLMEEINNLQKEGTAILMVEIANPQYGGCKSGCFVA
jgi:hypothetical protein